ncbi:hypothetical protein ABT160_29365 [Streptomyces sp. NPDC001941]|uniref:hypothetical protein n=1 Tax=Streptomyces sp. NPDC001941 TaxID=3154659 RepID=UPI00332ADEF4
MHSTLVAVLAPLSLIAGAVAATARLCPERRERPGRSEAGRVPGQARVPDGAAEAGAARERGAKVPACRS